MRKRRVTLLILIAVIGIVFLLGEKNESDRMFPLFEKNYEQPQTDEHTSFLSLPPEFAIRTFASDLKRPRALIFDTNNTLLTADIETGAVYALPDADKDGVADERITVLQKLDFPHSIILDDETLYIATKEYVLTSTYNAETMSASAPQRILSLPAQFISRHQTRTLGLGPDNKLYVSIGSTCDACEEKDEQFGSIIRADKDGSNPEIFARGLRNTVYFTFDEHGRMWGNDMGQDNLGNDLPPDEINIIEYGKHYGWPYCYGQNISTGFSSDIDCSGYIPPIHEYAAHSAPLGMTFINSDQFPKAWQGDILSALHGSWARSKPSGYAVVRIEIDEHETKETVFVEGFERVVTGLNPSGTANGRPAALSFAPNGDLYISDDHTGRIYRVFKRQ